MSKFELSVVPAHAITFLGQLQVRFPDFQATPGTLAAINELSCLLGGDPGAVRLLAAQLAPAEIRPAADALARLLAGQLEARLAVLEFAYRRLPPRTRVCYRRLAVFEGDFDAEAALVACADVPIGPDDISVLLDGLAERLLIERTEDGAGQHRYRLPSRSEEDAGERLHRSGELPLARGQLIDWLWSRVSVLSRTYLLPGAETEWLARRLGYLVQAVEWTWEDGRDDRHDLLACGLALLQFHICHSSEGIQPIRRALTRDPDSPYRSDLLTCGVWISELNVSPREVVEVVGEATRLARSGGGRLALIRGLTTLGNTCGMTGEPAAARRHFEEAVTLARQLGDPLTVTQCAYMYAWYLIGDDDPVGAWSVTAEASLGYESRANPHQYASFEFVLGVLQLLRGDREEAEARFKRSLGGYALRDPSICFPVEGLALVALAAGQPARCLGLIEAARKLRGAAPAAALTPRWWSARVAAAARCAEDDLSPRYGRQVVESTRRSTAQQAVDYAGQGSPLPYLNEADNLTGREYEIALLITDGLTNKQIAEQLRISGNTVSSHIRQIFTKLNVQSRAQLAAWMAGSRSRRAQPPELIGERHGSTLGLLRYLRNQDRGAGDQTRDRGPAALLL